MGTTCRLVWLAPLADVNVIFGFSQRGRIRSMSAARFRRFRSAPASCAAAPSGQLRGRFFGARCAGFRPVRAPA